MLTIANFPRTLDKLAPNRDWAQLRLATDAEIDGLYGSIDAGNAVVKATFLEWTLICIDQSGKGHPNGYFLYGCLQDIGEVGTSVVHCFDFQRGLVRTKNSTYRIRQKMERDLDISDLAFLGALLYRWGLGLPLGVDPGFIFMRRESN